MRTIYANSDGHNKSDGLTWKTRKRTVKSCLRDAFPGDTIVCGLGRPDIKNLVLDGDKIAVDHRILSVSTGNIRLHG